jgi:single-strand DNA-binding protein
MNNCVLMAEIVQPPQLRYTSDTQTAVAEFVVQFPGVRSEDPPSQLKVVGWGNLAQEIQERYHQGDQVVLTGRISIKTVDRPEGFREKQAEMTAQRVYPLGAGGMGDFTPTVPTEVPAAAPPTGAAPTQSAPAPAPAAAPTPAPDYDDIPF